MVIELVIALTSKSYCEELEGHITMTTESTKVDEAISELESNWCDFNYGVMSFIDHHNSLSQISKIDFKRNVWIIMR
jgi:uncharacterized protein (DUF302 family)